MEDYRKKNKFRKNRSDGDRFRKNRSDGDRFGGRDRERNRSFRNEREYSKMFEVICDKCGKECKVPFKPTRDKPIYCSNCFEKTGSKNKDSGQNNFSDKLDEINSKLDEIIKSLNIK